MARAQARRQCFLARSRIERARDLRRSRSFGPRRGRRMRPHARTHRPTRQATMHTKSARQISPDITWTHLDNPPGRCLFASQYPLGTDNTSHRVHRAVHNVHRDNMSALGVRVLVANPEVYVRPRVAPHRRRVSFQPRPECGNPNSLVEKVLRVDVNHFVCFQKVYRN